MVHQVASLERLRLLWSDERGSSLGRATASCPCPTSPSEPEASPSNGSTSSMKSPLTGSSRQTCPARHAQPVSSCYGYNLSCMYVCRLLHIGCIRMDIDIVNEQLRVTWDLYWEVLAVTVSRTNDCNSSRPVSGACAPPRPRPVHTAADGMQSLKVPMQHRSRSRI
jgi:hypothetical protein